jgi:hypothetical protein
MWNKDQSKISSKDLNHPPNPIGHKGQPSNPELRLAINLGRYDNHNHRAPLIAEVIATRQELATGKKRGLPSAMHLKQFSLATIS